MRIAGAPYRVLSDADATYIRTLASYVDEKIGEARTASQPAPTQKLAILAAMNIADELFQERRKRERLKGRVRDSTQALSSLLDQVERRQQEEAD